MNAKVKDPVCGMVVDSTQLETVHLGIHYAFCSEQCRERFVANPHLYVGHPGHQAPKQEGREIVKRRHLVLGAPLSGEQARVVRDGLGAMMGMKEVSLEGDRLDITYDLLQATEQQVEAKLGEIGVSLGAGWAERLRRAFFQHLEAVEVGNLESRPTHGHGSYH